MTDIKTIAGGVSLYFDTRLKPKLSGNKKLLLATAVDVMCQHPERIVNKHRSWLELMTGFDGEKLNIDDLSAALKSNMKEVPVLKFSIPILGDHLELDAEEIDHIVSCIESFEKEARE